MRSWSPQERSRSIAISPAVALVVFVPLSGLTAWSSLRAVQTGTITSRFRAYDLDQQPFRYCLALLTRMGLTAFFLAEVAFGLGFMADPFPTVQEWFDPFG